MKAILIIFITALSIGNLNATCKWSGLYSFPAGNIIKQNSIIVIEGYASSQAVVNELNKGFPVYLISGNNKIPLDVKEILVGQYGLTQAVLTTDTTLTVGLDYELVIENLPAGESLKRWNAELRKLEPIVYTVVQGTDNINPIFSSIPKVIKKTLVYYGCGPSIHVVFDCNVRDSSEYLIKATVWSLHAGTETSYYVEPENGLIKIGHEMCSGAFDFKDGDKYEIEFSIMDASGNVSIWKGDRIKFSKPTRETSYKNE